MASKIIHYISHYCGPQECDCRPRCHQRDGDEIRRTDSPDSVTCKNCLKGMAADYKRKCARNAAQIRSHKAWMDEARGFE